MGSAVSSVGSCVCGQKSIVVNNTRVWFKETIAEGGFSYVDLVKEDKKGTTCALKRILCHDDKAKQEALLEAKYYGMFKHENIIPIIDHCISHKRHLEEVFILFPFYHLGTLYDQYQLLTYNTDKAELLTNKRILKLFLGICEGLKVFHTYNPISYAHRDIKPANILLKTEDHPILMDLGSVAPAVVQIKNSRDAQSLQDLAAERCTLPYRAPELFHVAMHSMIDEKVDIWSLGCVFFSLLYLEGPFDKVWLRKDSVALAVQNKNLPFPSEDNYPSSFRELAKMLLHTDATKRPNITWIIDHTKTLLEKY